MKLKIYSTFAVITIALAGAAQAQSEDIKFSAGMKAWNHNINIHVVNNSGPNKNYDGSSNVSATAPLLSLTAKKGDFFITYSTLLTTVYALDGGDIMRNDTDLALGWSFTPGYSVLIGQKTLFTKDNNNVTGWNSNESKEKGYFLGFTGAQVLQDRWYAYESYVHAPNLEQKKYVTNEKLSFSTLEAGVGYALDTKTQFSLGYRSQVHKSSDASRLRDETVKVNGLIFGVSHNF